MLDAASLSKDGKTIASNIQLKKVDGAASLYQLDLMALKPPAGEKALILSYNRLLRFNYVMETLIPTSTRTKKCEKYEFEMKD